jgi:ABC-type antimicrobial peptide transport system ATPase subunit
MMEPLEKAAILMTLMKRLGQIMDHERALLTSLRLEDLKELQEEKAALAEAYELEMQRLRTAPETFAALDDGVREQMENAMRRFQAASQANLQALAAAQTVVDKVVRNIADGLARLKRGPCYQASGMAAAQPSSGQVISVAFNRKL